jgi:NADH:ubiquinone oxidoreductase subunit F (NADH-binding)
MASSPIVDATHAFLLPREPVTSLDAYLATDWGGLGIARANEMGAERTIDEITRSGLRGRGGGGFPTGRKWAGVRGQQGTHHYMVANGAEGEPGTFKDRAIMRANPYQVVEGVMVAAFAVGAIEAFIGLKATFTEEIECMTRAVQEMQSAGLCQNCTISIVGGPEEYLYGEETALLEVIEGKDPLPRVLRPFEHGLFATAPQLGWTPTDVEPGHAGVHRSNPTLVNNVETLANVAPILARGAHWFRSLGTDESPGNIVCTVVGDVQRPGVAEVELGTALREVIAAVGGGLLPGRSVKGVFSGVANAVIDARHLDVPVAYETMAGIDSGMGSAGFIVVDDSACMVQVAHEFSRFLYVESCGQCPPCKTGSGAITDLLARVQAGEGTLDDVEEIGSWLLKVTDGNRCYLAVEEQVLVSSILRAYPEEIEEHLDGRGCPRPRRVTIPKLVDVRDGTAVSDDNQSRKRPDWTYESA